MKKIFTLLSALAVCMSVNSQTLTTSASTAANISNFGRTWSIGATTAVASPLNNGQAFTDYLFIRGFDFSTLPANIVVNSMTVTVTRSAGATVVDNELRLVLNGVVYTGANSNAASTPTTWPATQTSQVYTFDPSGISFLTRADLTNANFGIAFSGRRTAGNISATVNRTMSITITYSVLAPLILTDFTVSKNADNHVDIRFSTATEDNVQTIFVERSTDGRTFEKLFTVQPKGARNVYTKYAMTDKTPVKGNNYYRISEIDKNGRWYYYVTKLINISTKGSTFNAYYNGGQIVTNISNIPGQYEVSLIDMSGITISRKSVTMNSTSAQVTLDAPSRTGVYIAILKGQGHSESIRVAVTK